MKTILINYKSGATVELRCKSFVAAARYDDGTLLSVKAEGMVGPAPLFWGMGEIESIWEKSSG